MSFELRTKDGLILATYKPRDGAKFLYDLFKINIKRDLSPRLIQEITSNEVAFKTGDVSAVKSSIDKFLQVYPKSGFYLTVSNLSTKILDENYDLSEAATFNVGYLEGDYYRIPRYVLSGYRREQHIQNDVLIHKSISISKKIFFHGSDVPYFEIIDQIGFEGHFIIGGTKEGAVPLVDLTKIVSNLPTRHGYGHYMRAQIQKSFSQYLDIREDYIEKYQKYLKSKRKNKSFKMFSDIKEYEVEKYKFIYSRLETMLTKVDDYVEADWQKEILEIVLLLFPKYSRVLSEVKIKTPKGEDRRLDFAVLDNEGNLDVVEIKQPFDGALVTKNKCRNNFVPLKELSTTVIQAEKYIHYLSKWGKVGEDKISDKYKDKLKGIARVKISSPKAILIVGRDHNLTEEQKEDLHLIRRHYSNITDILTYDDLLRRLNSLISLFSSKSNLSLDEGKK